MANIFALKVLIKIDIVIEKTYTLFNYPARLG